MPDFEGRYHELLPDARAEGGDRLGQVDRLLGLDDLLTDHLRPLVEALSGIAQALPATAELLQFPYPDLVGIEQPLLFPPQGGPLPLEALQLALCVRETRAVAHPLAPQVFQDQSWLAEEGPHVLPDQGLDVPLADGPQRAALLHRLGAAPPRALVAPAGHAAVPAQAPPAVAADQQPAQQVRMALLARRALAVQLQLPLGHGEGLRVDEGRPGDGDPLRAGPQPARRVLGRPAIPLRALGRLGRRVLGAIVVVLAGVEPVGQDLVHGGRAPARLAAARRHAALAQPLGDGLHRALLLDQPGVDLPDHRRLGLVDDAATAVAVAREVGVAVGACAGEKRASAGGVELAPAPALLEGGALELGEEAVDLAHQALLGAGAGRAVHEDDGAAGALQLLHDHVLIGVVAGQAVGCQDQHLIELAAPGGVAQAVQAGAVEAGAAHPIVGVAVLRRDDQPVFAGVGLQGGDLALDGPLLLLLCRRDAGIQRRGGHRRTSGSGLDRPARPGVASPAAGRAWAARASSM